jgi:hypothetical protein
VNRFTPVAVAPPAAGGFASAVFRIAPPHRPAPRAPERLPLHERVLAGSPPAADVFAASWCCSVGTTWTVELRSVDHAAQGRPAEWICSGVPTQQPAPEHQAADLLGQRGLLLFPVDPVDPLDAAESPPRIRSRRLIGYVTRDPELMRLAKMLTDVAHADREHPMVVAARWVRRGYSADAAARRIIAGAGPGPRR